MTAPADVVERIRSLAEALSDIQAELETAGFRVAASSLDAALDEIDSAIRTLDDDDPQDQS